jgi:hypothetical protein
MGTSSLWSGDIAEERLTGLDYARAREGHRGSIAEYCDGSKPTRAACALMMSATLRSGRSVDHQDIQL